MQVIPVQVIPTRVHAMMDYLVGALLVAAPWLFGFDDRSAATWVPVVLGLSVILYSLFTDYELGRVRRIPMPTHLTLDLGGGLLLALSPWLFGFADRVWTPHLIIGLIEMGTVLMSRRVPSDGIHSHARTAGVDRKARVSHGWAG
jgi:hypothetical protein